MSLGDQAGKAAVDELTVQTIPELLEGLNAALDHLERLIALLDGATVTLRLGPKGDS
jgi:hypothetical protein